MHTSLLLLASLAVLPPADAAAQSMAPRRLAGTWQLVLADNVLSDGSRVHLYGPNPQGILVFDATGDYSVHILSGDRPKFASNDKAKGTPEEYRATVVGSNSHYGTYRRVSPDHLLQGTWTLVRAEVIHPDGSKTIDPLYGADAKGLLIVDDQGRYSLQIFRPDRPKFASKDKTKGSQDEYKAAVLGTSTHFGRIVVDTAAHALLFHIDYASFPNSDDTDQKRVFQLVNGELSYRIPPRADGTTSVSVWRRAP